MMVESRKAHPKVARFGPGVWKLRARFSPVLEIIECLLNKVVVLRLAFFSISLCG